MIDQLRSLFSIHNRFWRRKQGREILDEIEAKMSVIDLPMTDRTAGAHALSVLHGSKSCTIYDVEIVVSTAEVTGTTTVDAGSTAGDADDWLNDLSVAATGVIRGAPTYTDGATATYLSACTYGDELADFSIGTDAGNDLGFFVRKPYVLAAGDTPEYTVPAGGWTEFVGSMRIHYMVNPV